MCEEDLRKLAMQRAEEKVKEVDASDYDGHSKECAENYFAWGFIDGYIYALKEFGKQLK